MHIFVTLMLTCVHSPGSCEVSINGNFIANIAEHSSFGDLALMYNSPRAATIKSTTHCTLWTLNRVFFKQAIVTSSSNQNVQLCQFLSKITLFENLGSQSLNQLARSLTKKSYPDGSYIITQGEIGEEFFVIYRGSVLVTKTGDDGKETELGFLSEGEVFGERALIKKEPRAANIIAQGSVECYHLDRHNFLLMLGGLIDRMNQMNEFRILRGAALFQGLNDKRLKILRTILNKYVLVHGQRLLQSDASSSLYIILEGQLESETTKMTYEVGDTTGSLDIDAPSGGTLVTKSDEAVVMSIHKQTLLEHIAAQQREENEVSNGTRSRKASVMDMSDSSGQRRDSVIKDSAIKSSMLEAPSDITFFDSTLSDFTLVSTLGRGTFGQVYRAKQKSVTKEVALKCLDKSALVESSQHDYVRREAIALQHFSHQFIVEYYGILESPTKIIFMLEYVRGVELWTYLYENKSLDRGPYGGTKMSTSVLYAGCILLALEHIHQHGYAYRDLKPENIVIGKLNNA
jgi:CRP-like cAMP-binding protein